MSLSIQRLNEINKTIMKLYGEVCCEMSQRMSLAEANAYCRLQEDMTCALGDIRGLIIIETAKKLADDHEAQEADIKGLAAMEAQR